MNKVELNPCQDCGCPGSQIQLVDITGVRMARGSGKSPRLAFSCPYCKRTTKPIALIDSTPEYDLIALIERWNSMNHAFEGGLL